MNGGDGNDTYIVDNVGDVVIESFDDILGALKTRLKPPSATPLPPEPLVIKVLELKT